MDRFMGRVILAEKFKPKMQNRKNAVSLVLTIQKTPFSIYTLDLVAYRYYNIVKDPSIQFVSKMKFTQYFIHTRKRPDRSYIKYEWIQKVICDPVHTEVQTDGRIRKWAKIEEEGKYLRVILLEDGETVHNAFFDRQFEEKEL